jgi:hypothetical protein
MSNFLVVVAVRSGNSFLLPALPDFWRAVLGRSLARPRLRFFFFLKKTKLNDER